ncbi:hypothetical protein CDL12_14213 [Handroanthus impetiginosus]|uniref:GATA-type domain-containing protein n=1 Tax=Handroanthus impetiginosus TaxID=429701 RepID=A0A2G9H6M9_9LAMI|nr:hypothetical protein CDL12_14213 [Handroanthus impetiginosus]
MRRQWPCSKCGFTCSSTWRSLHPYKPVICNTCRSKGSKNKAISDPFSEQILNNNGAKSNLLKSSSFDQISTTPSSSAKHENMALTVSQFGMIFGNLPFEPTLAIPVIFQDDKVDDHCKCGASLKNSACGLECGMVQIKKEYDCEERTLSQDQAKASNIWDPSKVQKKRRSKLPQYTLSPIARFINQLQLDHHLSLFYHHHHPNTPQDLKYDDVLIYEKCTKFLAENEIGLGAVILSPSVSSNSFYKMSASACSASMAEEMSSFGDDNESDAYSNCLIDVPIRSSPSH